MVVATAQTWMQTRPLASWRPLKLRTALWVITDELGRRRAGAFGAEANRAAARSAGLPPPPQRNKLCLAFTMKAAFTWHHCYI